MTTWKPAAMLLSTAALCLASSDASALPKNPICTYYPDHEIADCSVRDSKGNFVPCIRSAPMLVCPGVSVILSVGACELDSAQNDFAYLMCNVLPPSSAPGGGPGIIVLPPNPPILQP
jgi:hypothetical protein